MDEDERMVGEMNIGTIDGRVEELVHYQFGFLLANTDIDLNVDIDETRFLRVHVLVQEGRARIFLALLSCPSATNLEFFRYRASGLVNVRLLGLTPSWTLWGDKVEGVGVALLSGSVTSQGGDDLS